MAIPSNNWIRRIGIAIAVVAALAVPVAVLVEMPANVTAALTAKTAHVISSLSLRLVIVIAAESAFLLMVAIWWLWRPQDWLWLMAPRDQITLATLRAKITTLSLPNTYAGRFAVLGGIILLLLLVLPWYAKGHKDKNGVVTYPNAALINPIIAGIGATLLIYAAIRQAQTAGSRHEAQTTSDLQRRITESFSKAIEQLGSDKLEVRLGGIYALERISQESPRDYWTVMENLTAFVRERTQRTEAERTVRPRDQRLAEGAYSLWENAGRPGGRSDEFWAKAVEQEKYGEPPAADIVAVLTVLRRRSKENRDLEANNLWHLTFRDAVLKRASLIAAHLERSSFWNAHLEYASLWETHFDHAFLRGTHFEGAYLKEAHFEEAELAEAHLEGADLSDAKGLTQAQIDSAYGDTETQLPAGLTRPAHWAVL